ncbi:MAG: hypothetical protein KAT09_00095 [Candidatus Aegiribacteria sp.]|nr:hypothetical protein [Candidatus Aegiribacteria sp.]
MMNVLLLTLLIVTPEQWPRIAVTQPSVQFLGWQSDTAVVHETIYHDLAAEYEYRLMQITCDSSWAVSSPPSALLDTGIVVSCMQSIQDGTATYLLEVDASEVDLEFMYNACINFEEYLEQSPLVPVEMRIVRAATGEELWHEERELTWFGGECAPIFALPVLDMAVLSPDSNFLFFSILYGPSMEYFVTDTDISTH